MLKDIILNFNIQEKNIKIDVDYRIEIYDQRPTKTVGYRIKSNEGSFLLYGRGDPEKLLKETLESDKYFEERRKSYSESESENKFIIKNVKNLTLNNFKVIDEDGNEKVINKELKDVKELTLDDLLNLSVN